MIELERLVVELQLIADERYESIARCKDESEVQLMKGEVLGLLCAVNVVRRHVDVSALRAAS